MVFSFGALKTLGELARNSAGAGANYHTMAMQNQ